MAGNHYARDEAAIGALQKLRFFPLTVTGGKGCRIRDDSGRWLIDLSAAWGAASLGYGHPALIEAVSQAAADPAGASILSAASGPAIKLAENLLATLPHMKDAKVWFGHSGSDANETAYRAVTAATGRSRVLAFAGAYHGGTAGSIAISGHPSQKSGRAPGLTLLPYPGLRSSDDPTGDRLVAFLEERFASDLPAEDVAALFIEPIQSDGGVVIPAAGALRKLAQACRRRGILVICDEVKVGLARTGRMHCFTHEGFEPDLVCFGKGLGGGLPISALVGPAAILDHASAFAMQTLHGNAISVAAAQAVLSAIREEDLAGRAAAVGERLIASLTRLRARHRAIADVRGRGLAIGIEIEPEAGAEMSAKMLTAMIVYRAFELGAVMYYVGMRSNVIELTPPLTLSEAEADEAAAIIDQAISDAMAGAVAPTTVAGFAGW
jgi:4-aminobutyrate aminotransferase